MQPFFLITEVWISWCKQIISFVLQWSPVSISNFCKMCRLYCISHQNLLEIALNKPGSHTEDVYWILIWLPMLYAYKHLSVEVLNSHKRYSLRWQEVCKPNSWVIQDFLCPREWTRFQSAFQNAVEVAAVDVAFIKCVEKIPQKTFNFSYQHSLTYLSLHHHNQKTHQEFPEEPRESDCSSEQK